jgi:tRNA G18 (ribose-2'-O)-methylase SpoU
MRKLKITELNRLNVDEFRKAGKIGLTVVMDNIRSLHNVGSVFRTCDAFRVEQLFLCGITAVPPSAEIHKTALGAEDSVEWRYFESTLDAVDVLIRDGYFVAAVEQAENSVTPEELRWTGGKLAVVFGNEVKGVGQAVIDRCGACIEIPQYGTKHSLNVSVAAGIVIREMYKLLTQAADR